MRILIHTPQNQLHYIPVLARLNIDTTGLEVDFLTTVANTQNPHPPNIYGIIHDKLEKARLIALMFGYDYLFNVEHDIIPPANALIKLLSHKKDIVSGIYRNRLSRHVAAPIIGQVIEDGKYRFLEPRDLEKPFIKVANTGYGCIVYSAKFLKEIRFTDLPDDGVLYNLAQSKGYNVYIDTTVRCKHMDFDAKNKILEV